MKESDIRNKDVLATYLKKVEEDVNNFFDFKSFEKIKCPACNSMNNEMQFEKIGFTYVSCNECNTLFVNPRPTLDTLNKFYSDSPSTTYWVKEFFMPVAEARREKIFKPRAKYISDEFKDFESKKIGDIGSGFGIFIEELKKIWPKSDCIAIEPSTEMAQICRQKGISVIEKLLEEIDSAEVSFDLLTAFELFEHLHNPKFFLECVYKLLKPEGYFLFTTLNGLGFDIQTLWKNSRSVYPPHHLNFFNPWSTKKLLEEVGFSVINLATPGELDWDIVEGNYINEKIEIGRFWKTLSAYGTEDSKKDLQKWIQRYLFSSHMRIIAKKK